MEKIAVLIPCYNEESTIEKVIKDFKKELPNADIYVYNNNSKDKTAEIAKKNGAIVRNEYRQGKGNVVRSMFREIEADIYVMVDGDDTYPAEEVHKLIEPIAEGQADMVVGDRLSNGTYKNENKRKFHDFGNKLVKRNINKIFKTNLNDIMTGYRAFNKKFVKNVPIVSKKFEVETEMTLYALDKNFRIKEIPITYRNRPNGSVSKLRTFRDGIKILKTIMVRKIRNKNKIYISIKTLLSLFFAVTIMLDKILVFNGNLWAKYEDVYFKPIEPIQILILLVTFVLSYIILTLIEKISDKLENTIYNTKGERKNENIKVFFIAFLIILILWLPYILSYFPGGVYPDTIRAIMQAENREKLNNHEPLLYTMIFKIFLSPNETIEERQHGIEVFTIVQELTLAATCAYCVYWLYKKNISMKYVIATTLFFGVCNLVPLYAVSIWKDTLFSIALFLYVIYIAEITYQDGKNIEKVKGIIKYIVLSLPVMFLRNNGIYIITLTTIALLIIYRSKILNELKKFTTIITIQIIICFLIQGPVYNYFKVNTEYVENLGIMIQQICYVVKEEGNITKEQLQFINNLCPIEKIKSNYTPCLVDSIKWYSGFENEYLENNKGKFIKTWFELLMQNPKSFTKAYLLNTIGFWNINKQSDDAYTNQQMSYNASMYINMKQYDKVKEITNISIRKYLEPKQEISSVVFLSIMLIGMLITIYKKKYKNLLIYMPAFATWLTVMIATPIAFSLRYVYILVLMVPFSTLIPFFKNKQDKLNKV